MPVALEFGFSLVVILGAAVLFTNAVELLGERLKLGQGAVGSVLAAAEFTIQDFGAYIHVPMLAGGPIPSRP